MQNQHVDEVSSSRPEEQTEVLLALCIGGTALRDFSYLEVQVGFTVEQEVS